MTVEILYLEGCPNHGPARELVQRTLAELGMRADVQSRAVLDGSAMEGFAGSPTILINGRDVEPAVATGIACRIYANGTGVPSRETCERAIAQALKEEREKCSGVL